MVPVPNDRRACNLFEKAFFAGKPRNAGIRTVTAVQPDFTSRIDQGAKQSAKLWCANIVEGVGRSKRIFAQ